MLGKLSGVERLKASSHGLRGRLAEELAEGGTQVSEDGYNLLKFHGSYEQHDRDTATARKQAGQEKDFSFMLRVRMPGGALTAAQYLALDELADRYGNGTLRITTRQGIQFHFVVKQDLKPAIAAVNRALLTTRCACGDVVRNLMTTPAPRRDPVNLKLQDDARMLSHALLPRSHAYQEIFLDEAAQAELQHGVAASELPPAEEEPLYGPTYLPRKFKIGLARPEDNTPDVLANDLGLIAVVEGDTVVGYNVAVGGGLGMTHNKPATYPRLATVIGYVPAADMLRAVEAVIALQRDHGDRSDRRRARLKYVVDDRGLPWVQQTMASYLGAPLAPARPMPDFVVPELLGWHEQGDGRHWLGVPVASGRIADLGPVRLRTALRRIVQEFGVDPVMTPQQDVLLSNVADADRAAIEAILRDHGVPLADQMTPLARWTLACPALPTCGLALHEAERVRDPIVATLDGILERLGLGQERISLRITGCPNGCARTYTGDIGLVGRMPGVYALYVGGDFEGTRLSFKLLDKVRDAELGPTLEAMMTGFAAGRQPGEAFGAWCQRQGADRLLGLVAGERSAA